MCGRVTLFGLIQKLPNEFNVQESCKHGASCFNLASLLCHQVCSKYMTRRNLFSLSLSLHRGCLQCFARVLLLGRYSDTVSHGRPAKSNNSTDIPYVTSNVEQQRVLVPSLMYGCHWLPCGVVPVPKNRESDTNPWLFAEHRRPAPPRINSGAHLQEVMFCNRQEVLFTSFLHKTNSNPTSSIKAHA